MVEARRPLVIACQGGTPLARLAGRVAVALDELGAAEALDDPDRAVAEAHAGRRLIALDGCASACRTRLLEAKGVPPRATFSLAELGVDAPTLAAADPERLAHTVAARLRAPPSARRPGPSTRPTRPAPAPRAKRAHSVDDYLLAIVALASTPVACGALAVDAPTLAAHVSRLLGVSRAAAGETLARLETAGLVERSPDKQLLLTGPGRVAADRAVRRHRLLERFVGDYLGYPVAECYERARMLDSAFDDDAVEHLHLALGNPDRCPHGWPIDPQRARAESRELTALSALAEHEQAIVVCLTEHDGALLARLHELGLTPGTRLNAKRRRPDGAIAIQIGGSTRPLEPAAAAATFVHRQQ